MPPATERGQVRSLGPLADDRRRMEVDVGTHQLHEERDRRGLSDQVEEGLFPEQSRAQVQLVVLGAVEHDRLVQKRIR